MSTALDDVGEKNGLDEKPSHSPIFLLAKRLLFPILSAIFVALYILNTWGKISFRNLWYPYFIIACLAVLLASIYVTEVLSIYKNKEKYTASALEDLKSTYSEWKLSVSLLVIAVVYLYSVEVVGFFPASFVMMAVTMKIGGARKWRTIIPVCMGVLIFVYIMFVGVLGIRPPSGPLGIV